MVTARPRPLPGVAQRVLSPVARSRDWLWRVGEARRHIGELAPDLVHAHYVTSYGYLAARCGRHPLAMTAWGSDILVTPNHNRWVRWLTGWTLRQADLLTGDSLDLLERMAAFRPRAPLRQLHWGADMGTFQPGEWSAKRGFQIVSLRTWEPNYNIDAIVRAVALLRGRLPDAGVHLHLLGGGPGEGELRALVQSLRLEGRVSFHGRVDEAAMVTLMQACKVSVSVPSSDATSVAMLESMACALPVVASDLPANRQWLGAADGLLVGPRDASALASALESLWRDEARAVRIGRRHHEHMLREGSRSAQMQAMVALYEQLPGRAPAGSGA